MRVDREKQLSPAFLSTGDFCRNFLRGVALFIIYTVTALVSGLVTYCMLSVRLNWSEVSFACGSSPIQWCKLVWRPYPPPTATQAHSRVLSHLLPIGKQLFWVWFHLFFIQALSGRLHEARQPFARQWLAHTASELLQGGASALLRFRFLPRHQKVLVQVGA